MPRNQEIQVLEEKNHSLAEKIAVQEVKIQESLENHEKLLEKEAKVKLGLVEMKSKFQTFQRDFASQKSEMMGYHSSLQQSQKDIQTVKNYVSELEKTNQILSSQRLRAFLEAHHYLANLVYRASKHLLVFLL